MSNGEKSVSINYDSLVVEYVCVYLKWTDLKSVRLVNSSWYLTATENAQRRDLSVINILGYSKNNNTNRPRHKIVSRLDSQSTTSSLNDLTKWLKEKKNKFPCSTFIIKEGFLDASDLQEFVTQYGEKIKTLTLYIIPQLTTCPASVEKLLFEQTANLRSLTIRWPQLWYTNMFEETRKFRDEKSLPHLTHFEIEFEGSCVSTNCYYGILQILNAAVNLRTLQCPSFLHHQTEFVEILQETSKEYLIKDLSIKLTEMDLPGYERLSTVPLNLEKLTFQGELTDTFWPQGFDIGLRVLNYCSQSLETFGLIRNWKSTPNSWAILNEFNQIHFPKLTLFEIHMSPLCDHVNLQSRINLTFPVLTEVTIKSESLISCFPFNGTSFTVKSLRVIKPTSSRNYDEISTAFPNLQNLEWTNEDNFPSLFQNTIAKLQKLEYLKISIEVGTDFPQNSGPALDSTFTGFSEQNCILLNSKPQILTVNVINKLRVKPSILEMKELKVLVLESNGGQYKIPVTSVSVDYAFKFMPQLQVSVTRNPNLPIRIQ